MPKVPKISSLHIYAISPEKWEKCGQWIWFFPADEHKRFLKDDDIPLGVRSQAYQITQNSKFAIFLQFLKKNMEDKLNFLPADKDENLLQMMGMFKHSQSSQNSSITMSLQYLKKEVRDEVNFLHGDKDQSFLQVGMTKHLQSTQSNKSYLYNISKQKFEMTFIFYMQINIATGIVVLMWVAGHVQITQSTSIIQNIQIFMRGGGGGGGGKNKIFFYF